MNVKQEHPGHYWKTDDAAAICFNEYGETAPTAIQCSFIGHQSLEHGPKVSVPLAELDLVSVGEFGEGRPCRGLSGTKWTGSSHRYAIYQRTEKFASRPSFVIIEWHGGGTQGYVFESDLELFPELFRTLPPERLWDLCYTLAGTQNDGYKMGRQEMAQLFLQGRLKRKRRNNAYHLEILTESEARK